MGHPNKDIVLKTSRNLGVEINGEDFTCDSCLLGKLKRYSIPKKSSKRATKIGERFCVDI